MVAEHLLQGIVQQVGSRVVGSRGVALVNINASHELCRGVLGQLLDDVDGLAVLTLRVDNLDGLVLRDEHTLVAYLTTHLAIERRVVEHQLVVLVLLLGDLAVAQDMASVFGVVVADEGLLDALGSALGHGDPVAVLDGGGIAGTVLLLLHLDVELLLVDRKAILAADQLRQVEGEAVGIEQAEGLFTTQLLTTFTPQLIHCIVEQADTLVEGAQEGVFLLLHHFGDERLLSLQLGEGVAHLLNERGQQFIKEALFLTKERIGIADGTAQDAADDVTSLGVRGQLTIGNREGDGTKMVGTDTHGDVDLLLGLIISIGPIGLMGLICLIGKASNLLLHLDDGLEDVGIVVGVLTLQHTDQALEAHTRIDDVHRELFQ